MTEAVIAVEANSILEIGCGKFPIEIDNVSYLGTDIDPEAISYARQQGKSACAVNEIALSNAAPFDLILSLYAMHFAISDCLIRDVDAVASSDAIFCFNLIADDSLSALRILSRLAPTWPSMIVVKRPWMARREFFIVASRATAARAAGAGLRVPRWHRVLISIDTKYSRPDARSLPPSGYKFRKKKAKRPIPLFLQGMSQSAAALRIALSYRHRAYASSHPPPAARNPGHSSIQTIKFRGHHGAQWRQRQLDRVPDQLGRYVLILVPVDVPGCGDVAPGDGFVARLQPVGQPARCFRYDLQAPHNGVDGAQIGHEPRRVESGRQLVGPGRCAAACPTAPHDDF